MGQAVPLQEVVAARPKDRVVGEEDLGRLLGRTAPERLASDAG